MNLRNIERKRRCDEGALYADEEAGHGIRISRLGLDSRVSLFQLAKQ